MQFDELLVIMRLLELRLINRKKMDIKHFVKEKKLDKDSNTWTVAILMNVVLFRCIIGVT